MRKILSYLKLYRKEAILGPLFKLLEASFELLIPLVVANIIDVGIVQNDQPVIIRDVILMAALGLIGMLFAITAQYFSAKAAVGLAATIRHELFSHIQSLSYSMAQTVGTATLLTRITSDVNQVKSLLTAEYAAGGGDTPEAVAKALTDVIVNNQGWDDNYAHIAFLIFDAPPHKGTDQEIDAAVRAAAAKGIHVVPVVASNAERDTELFGRALAICTGSPYVFLTDDSGIGNSHLEPIIGDYQVEKLHDIIVRLIREQGN